MCVSGGGGGRGCACCLVLCTLRWCCLCSLSAYVYTCTLPSYGYILYVDALRLVWRCATARVAISYGYPARAPCLHYAPDARASHNRIWVVYVHTHADRVGGGALRAAACSLAAPQRRWGVGGAVTGCAWTYQVLQYRHRYSNAMRSDARSGVAVRGALNTHTHLYGTMYDGTMVSWSLVRYLLYLGVQLCSATWPPLEPLYCVYTGTYRRAGTPTH